MRARTVLLGVAAFALARRAAKSLAADAFFRDRVVLITGGSRGLGLVLARQLAARGARLALCARSSEELEAVQSELGAAGAELLCIEADVADAAQAGRAVASTLQRYGRLDVLLNVAGIIQVAPLTSLSLEDFRSALAVNARGLVHTSLAALPHLRRRAGARIVNVCSIGGAVPVPHLLPYTASKHAAVGFSTGLAVELGREGIPVTTVLPGPMRTGSFLQALFKGRRGEELAWFALAASLPVVSVSAEWAGRRILGACATGERYVTLGLPARALRLFHALLPSTSLRLLALANRLLPAPGGAGPAETAEPGFRHRSPASDGPWNVLGFAAARRNREIPS